MKSLTASQLRSNVYRLLDEVIETGEPIEISRGEKKVRIVPVEKRKRNLDKLPKMGTIIGDPESIIYIDWLKEWNSKLPE